MTNNEEQKELLLVATCVCPYCDAIIYLDYRKCPRCGEPLAKDLPNCPNCGVSDG